MPLPAIPFLFRIVRPEGTMRAISRNKPGSPSLRGKRSTIDLFPKKGQFAIKGPFRARIPFEEELRCTS